VTWRDVVTEVLPLVEINTVPSITRIELQRLAGAEDAVKGVSIGATFKHLLSSDVRATLRKDPILQKIDKSARGLVRRLGPGLETKLRIGIEGPISVPRPNTFARLTAGLCAQQLRGVRHSPQRAARVLGYDPRFRSGAAWLISARGIEQCMAWTCGGPSGGIFMRGRSVVAKSPCTSAQLRRPSKHSVDLMKETTVREARPEIPAEQYDDWYAGSANDSRPYGGYDRPYQIRITTRSTRRSGRGAAARWTAGLGGRVR
jgi:hypothetical protein